MNKQELIKKLGYARYSSTNDEHYNCYNKGIDTAILFASELDEQEKPVVSQSVDNWIQGAKYNGFDLYEAMDVNEAPDEVANWIMLNSETFAKAWLYGYKVEKEKLYTAQLKSTGEYLHYDTETDKVHHFLAYGNTAKNSKNYHFTKDTLLQYNAWKNNAYDVNEVEG